MANVTHLDQVREQRERWNQQNLSFVQRMERCNVTVDELVQRRYTVLAMQLEVGQPKIWIEPSKKAETDLKGIMYKRMNTPSGTGYEYQAQLNGCKVCWVTQPGA